MPYDVPDKGGYNIVIRDRMEEGDEKLAKRYHMVFEDPHLVMFCWSFCWIFL